MEGFIQNVYVLLKAIVDAIKAKTDNLPASPAAVGSSMTLTAAYDAAKTAASATNVSDTESNIRGADSDTLKTLSDQIDGVSTGVNYTINGVIVEDGNTGTPDITTIVTSASANTFGDWTEIDASLSADSYICGISINTEAVAANYSENYVLEIGTGANPSEAAIMRFSFNVRHSFVSGNPICIAMPHCLLVPIPKKVASGVRLSARIANGSANARNFYIGVQYYQSI